MNININIKAVPYQPTVTPPNTDNSKGAIDPPVALPASAPIPVAKTPHTTVSTNDVKQAVKKLNDYAQTTNRSLQFSLDQGSGVLVTKVIDMKTDKVIWQMPTEETIKMADSLNQQANTSAISLFSLKA
jgi:flagellar protein FlaG